MVKPMREERAIVLEFLPNGYVSDKRPMHMKSPVAQAVGRDHLVLLELIPKKGVFLKLNEEVYMGEGKRDQIHHIAGRIPFGKLTETAKINLEMVVENMVKENPKRFVDFFNKAMPINTRSHQMELIPGVGKKHMWEILEQRKEKPFESFEDMKKRVKLMPDPEKAIIKRILAEMKEEDRYRIFVGV